MIYSILIILLILFIQLYFRIAEKYQIIDRPNERSSHAVPTVRGGGIIFLLTIILWFLYSGFMYPWFVVGILLIAIISFVDDVGEQPAALRSAIHLIAFLLMGYQTSLFHQPWWLIFTIVIVGIGSINAFNFMDGINGITGVYALVNFLTFYFINEYITSFTNISLILFMIVSVLVFLSYNFKSRARCFAGDVGSVTLAFVQLFLVLQLIYTTHNFGWILIFLVYGVDTVITIIYRLRKKENIFKAHRMHLFQYFSNELGISHLWVSFFYGLTQLLINIILFFFLMYSSVWFPVLFAVLIGILYVIIREVVLKKIGISGLILANNKKM